MALQQVLLKAGGVAVQGDPPVTYSMCYQDYKMTASFLIFMNTEVGWDCISSAKGN